MLEGQIGAANARAEAARSRIAEIEGERSDWQPEPSGPYAATSVRMRVAEVLERESDMELEDLDCSELPCVLTVRWPGGDEGVKRWLRELEDQVRSEGVAPTAVYQTQRMADGVDWFFVTAAHVPEDADEDLRFRARARIKRAAEDVTDNYWDR